MDYSPEKDETIVLRENGQTKQVSVSDIIYIESKGYLSLVHLVDSKDEIRSCKLLKEYKNNLTKFGFIRISRNILLNLRYFKSIDFSNRSIILFNSNTQFQISRRKLLALKRFIEI